MCGGIIYGKNFLNGEFVSPSEAKVSYNDRGYVFMMVFMNTFEYIMVSYLQ